MTEPRFAARRRTVLFRRWRRTVAIAGGILVVGVLAWLVWFSSFFAVRTVAVDGETTLKQSQILAAADVRAGQPLARVDTAAIEARVASMSRIQDVFVSRSWPHTIRIKVVERKAIAYATIDGEIRAVDRYGIDFRTYSKPPKGLLEVRVNVFDARRRQQTLAAVAAVVNLIDTKDRGLRNHVQNISAGSRDSIVLNLTRGRTVTWGSGANLTRKLSVLKSLLGIKARVYDVSAPDQPTTRK
ncbi:MAG: cell division protein FtsQ [Nocardioidaceae bacterium]|nr:cell division protein FtsQ [Nocardioidaceae bacterium]